VIGVSGLSHDLRLKALKREVFKLYEVADDAISTLEGVKYFALRIALADDLGVAIFYLQHIEALVKDLHMVYKELLERFEHLKKIVAEPQPLSIQFQIMWDEYIAESLKRIRGANR